MFLLTDFPQLKIIQNIARRKKTDVYLVGGFLRDYVIGRKKNDLDFAVEKDALKVARLFADKIKGAYVLLDEERGCARVAKKSKGSLYTFDFADFRDKTFLKDLALRDFTINTLSINLEDIQSLTKIEDVLGDHKRGLKDIKAKRIKRVSVKAFRDDPLRMMRAFSLKATLGFRIELSTLNQIRKESDSIRKVSPERIREELFKILASKNAAATLKAMDRVGLLERIIPQIRGMQDCTQGGYHHLAVWPHSLETVVQLERVFEKEIKKFSEEDKEDIVQYLDERLSGEHTRGALIKLATLLHDIGKPDTRKKKPEGGFSFHGHENVGKDIVRHIARMLKFSTRERHALEDMVQMHLRPGYLSNFQKPGDKMIYRYFRDAKEEAVSIVFLSLADQRATRGPLTTEKAQKHHEKICLGLIEKYLAKKREKPFVRLINGDDLIKKIKIKPSPLFKKILMAVEEQQSLGKITTKKEALALAKKMGNPPSVKAGMRAIPALNSLDKRSLNFNRIK